MRRTVNEIIRRLLAYVEVVVDRKETIEGYTPIFKFLHPVPNQMVESIEMFFFLPC